MTPLSDKRLESLQVLRAIAALAIALHHTLSDAASLSAGAGQSPPLSSLVSNLAAGVDLFFVISGFVMVHASKALFASPGAPSIFLRKRLIRILPLYWLVTTLFLLAAFSFPDRVHGAATDAAYIVKSYLFIPALRFDGTIQPVFSLGWTLNFEMMFYVLFAGALVLPRAAAVAALVAALVLLVIAGWATAPQSAMLRFWTAPIILEFALGMLIGEAHARGITVAAPLAIGAAIAGVALAAANHDGSGFARLLSWGAGSALVVAGATLGSYRNLPSWLTPLVVLGDASYALYLTHPFAMRVITALWSKLGLVPTIGVGAYIVVAMAAAVMLALLTYRLIEVPILAALRARAGTRLSV